MDEVHRRRRVNAHKVGGLAVLVVERWKNACGYTDTPSCVIVGISLYVDLPLAKVPSSNCTPFSCHCTGAASRGRVAKIAAVNKNRRAQVRLRNTVAVRIEPWKPPRSLADVNQ